MAIKVHCKNCHTEWNVTENLEDVIDRDDGDTYTNETCLYTCPICHHEIECTVTFGKILRAISYH